MTRSLLRLREELGGLGLAGLSLIGLVAMLHLAVLEPLEARDAELKARAARAATRPEPGTSGNDADKVAAVYEFLARQSQTTDWLAKLHGIGIATGVQMKSATYRTERTEARIVRYEILLPVAGTYPQLREFLSRALAELPLLSVDQLTLRRENRKESALQAELRLTLHMVKSTW